MKRYPEYKQLNLPAIHQEVLKRWKEEKTFEQSLELRKGQEPFVFYEGPPSANGMPGIHHVLSRTIKDLFCRYQTLKGKQVQRRAGWDTHGLPIELGVEKELGITKEDIGKSISIAEYNEACRKAVMRYTDHWNQLTEQMGYWVDMEHPYITYKTKYIETVWWLLKQLWDKDMIYKGYTIQPYSPKAGTGLSSHELNQPGTYRDVKDTTVVAQFKLQESEQKTELFGADEVHLIAWTTTPWTLPANTALAVGPKIDYVLISTFNAYTFEPIQVVLAEALVGKFFKAKDAELELDDYQKGDKHIPWKQIKKFKGSDLSGLAYEQLIDLVQPAENPEKAFRVIPGDFVSTEDGTGIVHIAPTFGADDARVALAAGIPPMLVKDVEGNAVPIVDLQGKYVEQMGKYAGKYVKDEYYADDERPEKGLDVEIAIDLKEANRAFKVEKYEHSYPHCWRTDRPILYYPLDSWFIKASASRDTMIKHNNSINWKPKSTGEGRFGNWLENLNDWNLSRSRFWGIPLPIWTTEDGKERKAIGSVEELQAECEKSVNAGFMKLNPLADFRPGDMAEDNYSAVDLHRPFVDEVILCSDHGLPMKRETDLIDVWFDSGSMPYAQWHYPFENKEAFNASFPADFIAEGVDQTRGWFYTLHAIGSMVMDSPAYKNVVSNGLVLDKNGHKMSKRLGNAVDPFSTMKDYGADAVRWYMVSNAQPWDNLRFDMDGIVEVQRKFFGTLYNTYNFFALYANIDGFDHSTKVSKAEASALDCWIRSELNTLIREVDKAYADYEPTRAARMIQEFTVENLSNWFVRLSRRRFWKGEHGTDKLSAFSTLFDCLDAIARMMAPIAPFFADQLYRDLYDGPDAEAGTSVHLADFPEVDESWIDTDLQWRMRKAQKITSLTLGIRKKERIRVRQPLHKLVVPILNTNEKEQLNPVKELIMAEVNVKELELLEDTSGLIVKKAKPNFKVLGPRVGKSMKVLAAQVAQFDQERIQEFEKNKQLTLDLDGQPFELLEGDLEIMADDIPGWLVASEGDTTVALDIQISEELLQEGLARELVNRVQNIRKDKDFDLTDRIVVSIKAEDVLWNAILAHVDYISSEVLATSLQRSSDLQSGSKEIDLEGYTAHILVNKTSS
jgi:isoleucyl-tRNA synthetase